MLRLWRLRFCVDQHSVFVSISTPKQDPFNTCVKMRGSRERQIPSSLVLMMTAGCQHCNRSQLHEPVCACTYAGSHHHHLTFWCVCVCLCLSPLGAIRCNLCWMPCPAAASSQRTRALYWTRSAHTAPPICSAQPCPLLWRGWLASTCAGGWEFRH